MADSPDEVSDLLFAGESREEKVQRFDHSTAVELAKQMGRSAAAVKIEARKRGPDFTLSRVAEEIGLPCPVVADRLGSYSFEDLFHRLHNHPMVKAYVEHFSDDYGHLVLRTAGLGRTVVTFLPRQMGETRPVIDVLGPSGRQLYVHHFREFFALAYPDLVGELSYG